MNDSYKWHDLVRKTYKSYADAKQALTEGVGLDVFRKTTDAALKRKIDSGSEVVKNSEMQYTHIIEVISEEDKFNPSGSAYIEMRFEATLRDLV